MQAIVWGVVWLASGAGLLRILNKLWVREMGANLSCPP